MLYSYQIVNLTTTCSAFRRSEFSELQNEKFSFPPDTNFEKESDNRSFESKTALGFDFL